MVRYSKKIINLGFKPWKITNTSDYFDQLYDFAIQLIKDGHLYVDNSTKKEMEEQRASKVDSPNRNNSVEKNMKLFLGMKKGLYKEGEYILRAKFVHDRMRDFVCYRIKYTPHVKTKDKWCIYPSYDYTHCIVDSLENISYSLCTLEFEVNIY
jgi:glutaminyl-tRNA synthetase